jgi:hypothetical protein
MKQQLIENKIITIREQKVILDSDVAELYGVETKRINEAVKNNPDKFPDGYILYLSMDEAIASRSKFSTLKRGENLKYVPKAFSERGLYMLATILKSPKLKLQSPLLKHLPKSGSCPVLSPNFRNNPKRHSKSR